MNTMQAAVCLHLRLCCRRIEERYNASNAAKAFRQKGASVYLRSVERVGSLPVKSIADKHQIEVLVRNQGPISRVEIFRQTGLRRSTISMLTRQLLSESRLIEVGLSNNPLGRKQILLKTNPRFGFVAGVEFDDEMLTAGVMNMDAELIHSFSEPTNLAQGQDGLLKQLQRAVRRVMKESDVPQGKFLGIGIADPGLVNTHQGVTASSSTIDFWVDVPVQAYFQDAFEIPTLVESKTRTRTLAERILGPSDRPSNMIYLDYGTGIGAGVILDGQLIYGQNCGAGEIGHTHIQKTGPTCKCGSYGCLEALAGANAVEHRVRAALADGVASPALEKMAPAEITVWKIFEAASAGDKLCWNIVAEVAEDLGLAIANLVNLLNPALVVLDKRMSVAGDDFLAIITQTIKRQALAYSASAATVRYASLGADAGLRGVCLRVVDRYYAQAPSKADTPAQVKKSALRHKKQRSHKK